MKEQNNFYLVLTSAVLILAKEYNFQRSDIMPDYNLTHNAMDLRSMSREFDYISIAEATALLLEKFAVKTDDGIYWTPQPEIDRSLQASSALFYKGNAGHVFFLTQLYNTTKKQKYIDLAIEGARWIIKNPDRRGFIKLFPTYERSINGFYFGRGGIAFTFLHLGKAAKNNEYIAYAKKIYYSIIDSSIVDERGAYWSDMTNVMGDSGAILNLLYAYKEFSEQKYLDLAVKAGESILKTAEPQSDGSTKFWGAGDSFGKDHSIDIPGFEIGTAGIGFTLAKLYESTGRTEFLEGAKHSAHYLMTLAVKIKDGVFIPHHLPDEKNVYYVGYCCGSAGNARLFYLLYKITRERKYFDFLNSLILGLEEIGVPEQHSNGYWNTYSLCCGTGAVLYLCLGLWAEFGEKAYLDLAIRAGRHIVGEALLIPGQPEFYWYQAFERVEPTNITLDIGYWNGTSGIGAALLQLGSCINGHCNSPRLPDDPFPETLI
jgi:lantibiotic modifying enzyme